MKACLVADLALYAREVGYSVCHLLPYAVEELVGGRISRSFNRVMLDDQRVQLNHLVVIVQHGYSQFPGDVGWQGSDVGEEGLFRHLDGIAPATATMADSPIVILYVMTSMSIDADQNEGRNKAAELNATPLQPTPPFG